MKVVVPTQVLPVNYAKYPASAGYSNTGDFPEWSAVTAYVVGNKVIVDSLQSQFQCVVNNTGTAPTLTGTTPWIRIGASNAWKPFDKVVGSQSPGYTFGDQLIDKVTYRLTGLGRYSTVAVLSTDASSVRVKVTDSNFVQTYNQVIKSVDTTPIVDAWTYCFADCNVQRDFIFDGIDGWGTTSASILDVIIANDSTGITVQTGEIVVGMAYELGDCHAEPSLRLIDYSKKEANAFGEYALVERPYSKQGTFDLEIPTARRNSVTKLIETLRATTCVYFPSVTDANYGLVVYGFVREFEVTYHTPERTYANLQLEGLI